jgi:hypothetical protein
LRICDYKSTIPRRNADIVPGAAIVTGVEQGIYTEVEKCEHFAMFNESTELAGVWVDFD